MLEDVIGEFIHTRRRRWTCRSHHFVSHRINRANVVNELPLQIDGQLFTLCDHLRHTLMRRIPARVHRPRQEQRIARLPGEGLFLSHGIKINSAHRVSGLPRHLGPRIETRRLLEDWTIAG